MNPTRIPFQMEIPVSALQIIVAARMANKSIYVVGGAVRDAFLGLKPKDIDFATNATPEEIIHFLKTTTGVQTILDIGKSFGVIKVVMDDKNEYEIATFRSDIGSGRRPESVEFTSIDKDVLRRDLTINALFYDHAAREIVDYVGGIEDMKNRVIRTVGNPHERFNEDRLRVLRAIRFAERLGYDLHPEVYGAIVENNSLSGVSAERIREEFLRAVSSAKSVTRLLQTIDLLGLWKEIFPGLKINRHAVGCRNMIVLLAWLLRENEPRMLAKTLNQLKYSAEETGQIAFLVSLQGLTVETGYRYRKNLDASRVSFEDVRLFTEHNNRVNETLVGALLRFKLTISGEQLMSEGFQGAALGKELERREIENFRRLV